MRKCSKCNDLKPQHEFYLSPRLQFARKSHCRACVNKNHRAYRDSIPYKRNEMKHSWRRSGIIDVDRAWELRIGATECTLCGATENLHVDHDHTTGYTRNILCSLCNRGLGCFRDNVEVMKRAIDYVKNAGLL